TNILNSGLYRPNNQGKHQVFFKIIIDFVRIMLSNYGYYLGINRKMKFDLKSFCHGRFVKPSACKSARFLNSKEWSS
ncbi:MAG: hypothetical protein EBY22_17675, partial [Gammaproteobacteria bacterium]|nr:hypothetical protein [Gammaproteobacteria bacterium]